MTCAVFIRFVFVYTFQVDLMSLVVRFSFTLCSFLKSPLPISAIGQMVTTLKSLFYLNGEQVLG